MRNSTVSSPMREALTTERLSQRSQGLGVPGQQPLPEQRMAHNRFHRPVPRPLQPPGQRGLLLQVLHRTQPPQGRATPRSRSSEAGGRRQRRRLEGGGAPALLGRGFSGSAASRRRWQRRRVRQCDRLTRPSRWWRPCPDGRRIGSACPALPSRSLASSTSSAARTRRRRIPVRVQPSSRSSDSRGQPHIRDPVTNQISRLSPDGRRVGLYAGFCRPGASRRPGRRPSI
ncbi:hypothetical protein SO3561_01252 [Streptomyces olivochromogenes]|uniref:Uncharacterized protein n=1 Tax=Streptomyces olivochromogenes TaxID=1963 RepID=A0A250V6F5_STROL|nr:hypothetical protein SO3561_01252 [Streptomyces olivochromogenes]